MRLDRFSNPILNEEDIFNALYQGHTDILANATVDLSPEIEKLSVISNTHFLEPLNLQDTFTTADFDRAMQNDWFMPDDYKQLDIKQWILNQCITDDQIQRVSEELEAYEARNMLDLLRWLKYFVDICSKEEIVWGVGRGSSVASYILYLIGVHSVDSIKYNLDWQEFLR